VVEQPQVATVPTELTEEGPAEEVAAANPAEGSNVSPTSVDQRGSTNDSSSVQPILISLLIGAAVLMLGVGILVGLLLSRGKS
jgi:hypothetical protein